MNFRRDPPLVYKLLLLFCTLVQKGGPPFWLHKGSAQEKLEIIRKLLLSNNTT